MSYNQLFDDSIFGLSLDRSIFKSVLDESIFETPSSDSSLIPIFNNSIEKSFFSKSIFEKSNIDLICKDNFNFNNTHDYNDDISSISDDSVSRIENYNCKFQYPTSLHLNEDSKMDWRQIEVTSKENKVIKFIVDYYSKINTFNRLMEEDNILKKESILINNLNYILRFSLENGLVIGLCDLSKISADQCELKCNLDGSPQYNTPIKFSLPSLNKEKKLYNESEDKQNVIYAMIFHTGLFNSNGQGIYAMLVKHEKGNKWDSTLSFRPWKCVLVCLESEIHYYLNNKNLKLSKMFPFSLPYPDKRYFPLQMANFFFPTNGIQVKNENIIFNSNLNVIISDSYIYELLNEKEKDIKKIGYFPSEFSNIESNELIKLIKLGISQSVKIAKTSPIGFCSHQYFTDGKESGEIQLQLPICLNEENGWKADCVLSLKPIYNLRGICTHYKVVKILSLVYAALNARLVSKTLPTWLSGVNLDSFIINEKKELKGNYKKLEKPGKPCSQYFGLGNEIVGSCKFESYCRYSHDLRLVQVCNNWKRGGCKKEKCSFLHRNINDLCIIIESLK